jgi:hypothetical protein
LRRHDRGNADQAGQQAHETSTRIHRLYGRAMVDPSSLRVAHHGMAVGCV